MPNKEEFYEFWTTIDKKLVKLVGRVVREIPAQQAREEGRTTSHKRGMYLILEVGDEHFEKFKNDAKKVRRRTRM